MANISRWDPFQDMLTLREAMNQLLEDSVVSPRTGRNSQALVVPMDLSETVDGYHVEAAVPGLKPDDLEITLENNVLTIKGETRQETTTNDRQFHRVERQFGSFRRTIGLPTQVKGDAIEASLNGGVLSLFIPKAEEVKPRKITVNLANTQAIDATNN